MMTERRPQNSSGDRCAIILTRCISIFTRHTFRTYKTFKCTAAHTDAGSAASAKQTRAHVHRRCASSLSRRRVPFDSVGVRTSPHRDRRLNESGLVRSAEEQVRSIVGDDFEKHVHRRLVKDVADRSRTRISESIRSGSVEEVRHPSLLHSQRGNESEHRRKIQ